MFVDELTIFAKAGDGGTGVVRWRHEKYKPMAGPAGGDGGKGGDVYFEAVADLALLAKYTAAPEFFAANGDAGQNDSKHGRGAEDVVVKVPVGSIVTNQVSGEKYEFFTVGKKELVLKGGRGGYGNEHFKSSTNRAPEEHIPGQKGEEAEFFIELTLVVDAGLIGQPNAGKSSLLNTFTNAKSRVGAYPFTTLQPHLGDLYGFVLADIPGLIEGASTGKGLGHTFLRHVKRTKMLLHLVSLEQEDPLKAYYTIREELSAYQESLAEKEEWIIFTKTDLVNKDYIESLKKEVDKLGKRVFFISTLDGEGVKNLQDTLVAHLRNQ